MNSLSDIKDHSQLLSKFLNYLGYNCSDWFDIASKIENIEYDSFKYDTSMGLCEAADELDVETGKLNEKLIPELLFFNLIWSGLECLVTELNLKNCPHRTGKINSATYTIKTVFEPLNFKIGYYDTLLYQLKYILEHSSYISEDRIPKSKLFSLNNCNSHHGLGLSIVYKIRNDFAHGGFKFPLPKDWNMDLREPREPNVFNISSRLVLLSIQMLLITMVKDEEDQFLIEEADEELFLPSKDYLRVLHYYDFNEVENPEQLKMDFFSY